MKKKEIHSALRDDRKVAVAVGEDLVKLKRGDLASRKLEEYNERLRKMKGIPK